MKYVAQFKNVSYEQFEKDMKKLGLQNVEVAYDNVKIPKRVTTGSAGYDFVSPISFTLYHGESIIIPTGIRCLIDESWVLNIYPRSGLGFKTHVRLANSVGIIDSDYYYADNEGHIMIKLVADKPIEVKAGDRIAQGVFTEYGITVDDNATESRHGGIGSSGE